MKIKLIGYGTILLAVFIATFLGAPRLNGQHYDNGIRAITCYAVAILVLLPILVLKQFANSIPRILSAVISAMLFLGIVFTAVKLPELKRRQDRHNEFWKRAKEFQLSRQIEADKNE